MPAPPAAASPPFDWGRRFRVVLLSILLAGTLFRAAQYLSNRSFWEDESFLVLNIRDKSAAELMGRLDNEQAAPPLFLLTERAAAVAFGASEYALRLLPLAAGIAALGLMAFVTCRVVAPVVTADWLDERTGRLAALAGVGLFAASDRIIWRAAEVKPYGCDAMAALILTAVAVAGAGRVPPAGRLARAAAAATVLVWFSFPAAFVFAGISLALLPGVAGRRSGAAVRSWRPTWRGAAAYAACNLPVAASFVALYVAVARHQRTAGLDAFWQEHFADPTRPLAFAGWLARHLYDLCHSACEPLGPVVLALFVAGIIVLVRGRRWEVLGVLTLPVVVAIAAACAQRYPFDGKRLTTFLLPGVLVLAGVGSGGLLAWWQVARGGRPAATTIPTVVARWALPALLVVPSALCAYHLVFPRTRAHVRPAVEFVAARYQPGDAIYCDPHPTQVRCYWPPATRPEYAAGPPPVSLRRLAAGGGTADLPGRFWVVVAYMPGHERRLDGLLAPARAAGTLRDQFLGYGGAAYLFETTRREPAGTPTSSAGSAQ